MPRNFGSSAVPYSVRRLGYQERKHLSVWPEGKRMALLVYCAPEQWMWDRNEPFPPSPVRVSPGEPLPSFSSRTAVEYGFEVGLPRMCDILAERELSLTMWTNGNVAGQYPDLMKWVASQGHEIEAHGFSEGRPLSTMSRAQQHDDVAATTAILEEVIGSRPRGWIGPGAMATTDTVEVIVEHGYSFHSDLQDDELPYFIDLNGGSLVEIPYRMVGNLNDLWLLTSHYRSLSDAYRHLVESLDASYEAAATTPLTFIYGTHPYVSGRPDFAQVFRDFLDYAMSKDEIWVTTFRSVADWWTTEFGDGYGI